MNAIGIIIPWYGKLPNYFPFFIKGCQHNVSILDIHFFTDQDIDFELPSNVFVHKMNWTDLEKLFTTRINGPVTLTKPYKLCDYKPMFGLVFEDYLKSYTFWGYSDIDLIYGDLKKYLTPKILVKYDVLTFREFIVSGAFTILKNNEYTRTLFQKSPDLDFVFSAVEYVSFDESGKKRAMCRKRIPAYDLYEIDKFVCWTSIIQSEEDKGHLLLYARDYLKESLPYNTCLTYSSGEIKSTPLDEYIGYHLVTEKRNQEFVIPSWTRIDDLFYITPTGFYKKGTHFYFLKSRFRKLMGHYFQLKKRISDSYNFRIKHYKN
jgi:hypothetical protein